MFYLAYGNSPVPFGYRAVIWWKQKLMKFNSTQIGQLFLPLKIRETALLFGFKITDYSYYTKTGITFLSSLLHHAEKAIFKEKRSKL